MSPCTGSSKGQIVEVSIGPVLRERHDVGTVRQKLIVGGTTTDFNSPEPSSRLNTFPRDVPGL